MPDGNKPTLKQVNAEILSIQIDEKSSLFQDLNHYISLVNRTAEYLECIGEQYDYQHWSLSSEQSRNDKQYVKARNNAVEVVWVMAVLFRMNSARRLLHHAKLRTGELPNHLQLYEDHWLTSSPRWDRAFIHLGRHVSLMESNVVAIALPVAAQVPISSPSPYSDPIHELHESRFYQYMLKVRTGTVTLWKWLQYLARCGSESLHIEMIYLLIGGWFMAFFKHLARTCGTPFPPIFRKYLQGNKRGRRGLQHFYHPVEQHKQYRFLHAYCMDQQCFEIDSVLDGLLYEDIIRPRLIQCTRTLRAICQIQKRFRDWYWRPAQERADGTFDMNTAGCGVLSRLQGYRQAHPA